MSSNCITEELDLWGQNSVECIQELLENSAFGKENAYTLYHVHHNQMRKNHKYRKMATADWWWETQVC